MRIIFCALLVTLSLLAGVHQVRAQGAEFFRISGPTVTTITAINSDGTLVWSNALAGMSYTVQIATTLANGGNWVDYVQLPVTNAVNTNQVIDVNPPSGMALIPAGSFTMGDSLDGEDDATPTITVYVSAFYMDVNLVSYSQWQSVYNWAAANGYGFDNAGSGKAANHPVQTVDWYDCIKWCNARSQEEGLTPVYYMDEEMTQVDTNGDLSTPVYPNWSANGYRLPTEAEWEKAARGGLSGQRFPWGDTISENQANYFAYPNPPWPGGYTFDLGPYSGPNTNFDSGDSGDYPYTSPVGYFAPNGYGLYDMAGNVMEWCWDEYGHFYAGGSDPRGPTPGGVGGEHVLRGGSFITDAGGGEAAVACAARDYCDSWYAPNNGNGGFRCVRGL